MGMPEKSESPHGPDKAVRQRIRDAPRYPALGDAEAAHGGRTYIALNRGAKVLGITVSFSGAGLEGVMPAGRASRARPLAIAAQVDDRAAMDLPEPIRRRVIVSAPF